MGLKWDIALNKNVLTVLFRDTIRQRVLVYLQVSSAVL